jgi:hypothetical protein
LITLSDQGWAAAAGIATFMSHAAGGRADGRLLSVVVRATPHPYGGHVDKWRMTRLSVMHGPSVFWDEGAVVPDGTRRSGERLEVPAEPNARRRWQRAAEVYVTEVADAVAERDAARVAPKPRFWWTPRRRRRAAWEVMRRADSQFTERVDAAASAYRPHDDEIQALLDVQREAAYAEAEARQRRIYKAFYAWHNRHDGRRTLADAAQWRSTVDGDGYIVDLGGESDAYPLAATVPGLVQWTSRARAAVETATGEDAGAWWEWVHGTARNLRARERAVARLRAAVAKTVKTLRAAGFPGAEAHVLDSSPRRPVTGWIIRFDRAALAPPLLPMPPEEVLRSGTFSADVFMYGVHSDHVFTTSGQFAWTSSPSNWYLRSQRQWTHDTPDWFADISLDPRLTAHGPSGHGIRYEYPVTHLLPPDIYIPYIDAASELMAETVRAVS